MTPSLEIVSRKKNINVRTRADWIQGKKICPVCQVELCNLQSVQCITCRYQKAVIEARAKSETRSFNGILCRSIPLTRGYVAWIDESRFDDVSRWKWSANVTHRGVRAFRNLTREEMASRSRTQIKMHRYIKGDPEGKIVDHRDGDGLHNWDANLRIADDAQNTWNSRDKKKKSSLPRGVSLDRQSGKYQAQIRANGKKLSIGYFLTAAEAGEAYARKSLELHGEFSSLHREERTR